MRIYVPRKNSLINKWNKIKHCTEGGKKEFHVYEGDLVEYFNKLSDEDRRATAIGVVVWISIAVVIVILWTT